ncbi:sucrose synthase (sucrose-UDP glucosyltransferase) [Cryobacterium sp. LW097]|uniref:glycosyltransferase n=1 Tax=Cryobacterium sp. LW097 TaxID=1978566 RepID=UPI000B4DA1F1|nr:glycosyltransferase [Cryobacterium sp. LW097]ASD21875.1 sucrose synthase (sucrose-UDP glucosyltransferase) [Cryobacterium sp. LW097]
MGTHTTLDEMRQADSILAGIRSADDLTIAASRDGGNRAVRLLTQAALDPTDQLTAIAAVHSLAQVFDESADDVLVSLLEHDSAYLREHAAWAFGTRLPRFDAIGGLLQMVVAGGFSGMIAQRTLEQWAASVPEHVALATEGAMLGIADPAARARLVETLGLISGRIPERMLRRIAGDAGEGLDPRAAAVAALGDRPATDAAISLVTVLARGDDDLADVARLALLDLTVPAYPRAPWSRGQTVAQLFLHADIDRELSQVGSGDNGGIATLLVRLGDALVAGDDGSPAVDRVLTLSRGGPAAALACLPEVSSTLSGHAFATVPFLGAPISSADAWPRRVAVQRGIRRILRAAGTVDVMHLRMADVGTLAASTVARELEIPIVFTVAPDPHSVINAMDASGALTRANFGTVDEVEHFWFRARLVQRIAADAAHTVLFPRPELERDMRDLVGIDITAHPERHSVVAEGIDLTVIERSAQAALQADPADFTDLDALLETLPASRRHLPLAVTVGRLHRVKGMATLVHAWADDAALRERCNLLIVGGDLLTPSVDERRQLDLIGTAVPLDAAAEHGLLLAGHRANDAVARWLAAARHGRPGLAAPRGVYVCASMKEEFGIALLEAMATGLTVVAPDAGGPATYVEDGTTGFLVNTADARSLAGGITAALDLASSPFGDEFAQRAGDMVSSTFAIQAMAGTLGGVYTSVAEAQEALNWALSVS